MFPEIGGIRIHQETTIVVEEGRPIDKFAGQQHITSQSTTIRSIKSEEMMDSQFQQYTRPKTFRKLSNASSIISDIFRPETTEDTIQRKIKQANDRDTARDLIDFLRNTSPPPHNYMSFPDKFESPSSKKHKSKKRHTHPFCLSFWKRSKSAKIRSQQKQSSTAGLIKLPDSAVAGRTIGGHSHIAISIPVEYAHLDPPPATTTIASTTVLKPVEEKRESFDDGLLSEEDIRSLLLPFPEW